VILVRDRGEVACFDPATGKTVWEGAFPKQKANYYASPLVAGDRLLRAARGRYGVRRGIAGDKFQLLAENEMDEPIIGSPVPVGNRLLIRGTKNLFCIAGE
jgi:hypothetical protein